MSGNAPYRDDPNNSQQYEGEENHTVGKAPANSYFKRPIKILASITSLLSVITLGLLIATSILLRV